MKTHGKQVRETILLPVLLQAALKREAQRVGGSLCGVVRIAIENELIRRETPENTPK